MKLKYIADEHIMEGAEAPPEAAPPCPVLLAPRTPSTPFLKEGDDKKAETSLAVLSFDVDLLHPVYEQRKKVRAATAEKVPVCPEG